MFPIFGILAARARGHTRPWAVKIGNLSWLPLILIVYPPWNPSKRTISQAASIGIGFRQNHFFRFLRFVFGKVCELYPSAIFQGFRILGARASADPSIHEWKIALTCIYTYRRPPLKPLKLVHFTSCIDWNGFRKKNVLLVLWVTISGRQAGAPRGGA